MKTIVINSAKGGVGKTRTTVQLAEELIKLGQGVAILDLDITTPNAKADGCKIYSNIYKSFPTKTQIKKFIKESVTDAERLGVDYLIVDTPPTINETYLSISSYLKNAMFLFVTTRDKAAVYDTAAGMRFFALYGIKIDKVIINMSDMFYDLDDEEIQNNLDAYIVDCVKMKGSLKKVARYVLEVNQPDFKLTNLKSKPLFNKLSKITIEEVQNNNIPLRFYNLETWEIIRERIVEKEIFGKTPLDVSSDEIEPYLNLEEDEEFYVQLKNNHIFENEFLPFEILKCYSTLDNTVSNGLPMIVTTTGHHFWIHEVSLIQEDDIQNILDEGGINKQNYILLDFFNQLYMNRAFNRTTLSRERQIIKLWISKSGITPSIREIMFSIAILENDKTANDYTTFSPLEYYTEQKELLDDSEYKSEQFQEFINHLEILQKEYK